jgi:hypothetical protein
MSPVELAQRIESNLVGWRLSRLRDALRGPLAVITAGGLRPVAVLWARLHEASGHPAWTMTPYDFLERSLPPGTRVLILSRRGRHHDVLAAARHARQIGCPVHAIVESTNAPLVAMVRNYSPDHEVVVLDGVTRTEDPGDVCRSVAMSVLATALYPHDGPTTAAYSTRMPSLPDSQPSHVVALGVGLAYPAALDFSIRVSELGFAASLATDPRNLSHAIARPFDPEKTWFVFFTLPHQLKYATRFAENLPESLAARFVTTTRMGSAGAVELMARSALAASLIGERPDCRSAAQMRWVSDLYFLSLDSEA